MIVITGATGPLNGATVHHLLERIPAGDIVVGVRDTSRATHFADLGVEVRRADYAEPETLPAAFAGADQVLLVSSSDPGADAVSLHRTAIDAAVGAGASRILYTSHQGAAPDNPFLPTQVHAATEELLATSGVAWTALRNGFYAHTLHMLMGDWRDSGVIAVPLNGPVSWTAREDAAEAAAIILAGEDGFDGPTTLTASTAPTFEEIAATASRLTGRPIELRVLGEEAWLAGQLAAGSSEFMARFTLGIFQGAERGSFAAVDPLLKTLLGREPRTVEDLLSQPA